MSPLDPQSAQQTIEWVGVFGKLAGYFCTFVGGIVSATAAVTYKISGYDARIKALEESSKGMTDKIYKKLDRLHERIDDILLTCPPQVDNGRHERRGGDEH